MYKLFYNNSMYRNSYIKVDLDNLQYNARYYMKKTNKKLFGVIKANGYGLVDYIEAKTLLEVGVDHFAVSSLDEAINLRKHGINSEILVLGHIPSHYLDVVRKYDISMLTISKDYVESNDLHDIKVHIKIDTGMNRIGIEPSEAKEVLDILLEKKAIVEGIMSHFSSADDDVDYSTKQYNLFKECVKGLDYNFKYIHMQATDASSLFDDDFCNYCRIGLGLLGLSTYEKELKPVISLYSLVTMTKKLEKGETVSYGRHYTSDGNGYISTIALGYADGFFRSNTGKQAYIEDEYASIVGSICMDQMMIHTDNYHPVESVVELFGEHIDIEQRAKDLNTISYELITALSERLSRYYYKNGVMINKIDPRF